VAAPAYPRDEQAGDEKGCSSHVGVHRSGPRGSLGVVENAHPQPLLEAILATHSTPGVTCMAEPDLSYDSFPDLGALSDEELKGLIQQHTEEEQEVSYTRRILHGKIDILRAELVNRLRKKHQDGESVITGADVQQLTDILAGKSLPDPDAD
jgi:hypothetical protein